MIASSKTLSRYDYVRWGLAALVMATSILLGKQVAVSDFSLVTFLTVAGIGLLLLVRPRFRFGFCLIAWWIGMLNASTDVRAGISIGPGQLGYGEIAMGGIAVIGLAHMLVNRNPKDNESFALPRTDLLTKVIGVVFLLLFGIATVNTFLTASSARTFGLRLLLPAVTAFSLIPTLRRPTELARAINLLHLVSFIFLLYAYISVFLLPLPLYTGRAGALVGLGGLLTLERAQYYSRVGNRTRRNMYLVLLLPIVYYVFVMTSGMAVDMIMFICASWLFLTAQETQHPNGGQLRKLLLVGIGIVSVPAIMIIAVAIVEPYLSNSYPADWVVRLLNLASDRWVNTVDRYIRWQTTWKYIVANPFRLYFIDFAAIQYANYWGFVQHAAPHNIYIQAAASLTVFSPFLILYLLVRFIRFGFRTASRVPEQHKGRVLALTSLVAGAFVSNFLTDKLLNYQFSLIVWLAISLVMAASALDYSSLEISIRGEKNA